MMASLQQAVWQDFFCRRRNTEKTSPSCQTVSDNQNYLCQNINIESIRIIERNTKGEIFEKFRF